MNWKIDVFFIGFQTEIAEWLARRPIRAATRFLRLPLSILEAMAAGKPVVATQIEGVDEAVVPGETGLLIHR
jgi:glycosyltransferase involved in cell wall biosynthesis